MVGHIEVVDNEDVGGNQEDTCDIANNNLAVEIKEIRNRDIDNKGDGEKKKTDTSKNCEDQVESCVVLNTITLYFLIPGLAR